MTESVVSVRIEVYEDLAALKRPERERIIRWFETLRQTNFQPGDFNDRDDSGRIIQVRVIGRHALSYWHDGPVNEFKVVKIELADE